MKKFKQLLCLALALTISASLLAACGQKNNGGSKDSDEKVLTYAVADALELLQTKKKNLRILKVSEPPKSKTQFRQIEIGRASCRERV